MLTIEMTPEKWREFVALMFMVFLFGAFVGGWWMAGRKR